MVFVAAGIAGFAPSAAAQIVSAVVQVVAGTAKELQSRHRRNTFLDRANQDLFMPRGMYAMVMAFKDEVPGQQPRGPLSKLAGTLGKSLFSSEKLDINQTAAKYSNPNLEMSKFKKSLKDIRLVSGKTYTEVELPEAAALVYPDLDRAVEKEMQQEGNGEGKGKGVEKTSTKDKFKGAGAWVQDYLDRKAQATFVSERSTPQKYKPHVPNVLSGERPPGLLVGRPLVLATRVFVSLQRSRPPGQQWLAGLTGHWWRYKHRVKARKTRNETRSQGSEARVQRPVEDGTRQVAARTKAWKAATGPAQGHH